jgi:nucleoside-diphosphate-sugar epimerase
MTVKPTLILFTGASSGLGKDVLELLKSNEAFNEASVRFLKAGRSFEDDIAFDLEDQKNGVSFSDPDLVFHFAWDRADLTDNSRNIRATRFLVNEMKKTNSRLVLISSVEAKQGCSEYAKQKRFCEDLVITSGGIVLRLGAVIGGRNDFFSLLRNITSIGLFRINLVPDPLLETTRIETLVDKITKIILSEPASYVDTLVDESSNLSDILKVSNREINIWVPFWLVRALLYMGGLLVPVIGVWRDRFLALETR